MRYKKLLLIMLISCFCLQMLFAKQFFVSANSQIETYARITNNTTYLYKTATENENVENKLCLLAQTFFVKVLTNYNENFYKVQYSNLTGYVKKQEVQLVNEIPKTPYPSLQTITIKNNVSCYLRSTPKVKGAISNIITIIPSGANVTYIGKIIGEEAIDLQGNIWYLVKYNDNLGYIYSFYSNTFLPTQTNNEVTTLKLSAPSTTLNPLSNTTSIIIIVAILLPLVLILFLLYKPTAKFEPKKPKISNTPTNVLDSTKLPDSEV